MLNLKLRKQPTRPAFRSYCPERNTDHFEEPAWPPSAQTQVDFPKLRRIIAATDLSDRGAAAVTAAFGLADRAMAKLLVTSVVEVPKMVWAGQLTPLGVEEWTQRRQDEIRRSIELQLRGAQCGSAVVHVGVGDPVVLVPGYALGFRADLLVVGAHGHSPLERLLTEINGEEIAECAGVPVMFAVPSEKRRFDRIMVAIDLSANSQRVLEYAQLLAQIDNSAIQVVHVQKPRPANASSLSPRAQEGQREINRKRLEELVKRSPLGPRIQCVLLSGHPARAMTRKAAAWDADLIVTGLKRYGVKAQPRLGRTPRYLLNHTGRSLVVVP